MTSLVNRTVSHLLGAPVSVSFQVLGAPSVVQPASLNGTQQPPGVASPPVELNPRFTFATFTMTSSNRLAYRAARRLANGNSSCNPLLLSGAPGLGKTHLLHAIGHHALEANKPVVALTAESFVDRYGKAVRAGHPHTFRELFDHCGFLLVDDLSFLISRTASQEQFLHIFNSLHSAGCFLAVTLDAVPNSLTGFSARLRSRLQAGLTTQLSPPTADERLIILRALAAADNHSLPATVLNLIAEQPFESIRELSGALNRVTAYADISPEPLSIETVHHALHPLTPSPVHPTPTAILDAVCKHFHLTQDHLVGPSRARDLTYARHIAMYLLRQYSPRPLTEIGRILGGRDHSTVLSGFHRIEKEAAAIPQTRTDIEQIRAALRNVPAA